MGTTPGGIATIPQLPGFPLESPPPGRTPGLAQDAVFLGSQQPPFLAPGALSPLGAKRGQGRAHTKPSQGGPALQLIYNK